MHYIKILLKSSKWNLLTIMRKFINFCKLYVVSTILEVDAGLIGHISNNSWIAMYYLNMYGGWVKGGGEGSRGD